MFCEQAEATDSLPHLFDCDAYNSIILDGLRFFDDERGLPRTILGLLFRLGLDSKVAKVSVQWAALFVDTYLALGPVRGRSMGRQLADARSLARRARVARLE